MSFIEYTVRVHPNGSKWWYLNGKFHREDGPAIEYADGTKKWCLNDKLHREDGPAVEWSDGAKKWYLNGKPHREDGPAFERSDGTKSWYLNGECMTEKEFNERTAPDSCEGKVVEIDGKKYRLTQLGEE
jgi:antitoxin component YwqK of YwqJK toxin-antitoxin module